MIVITTPTGNVGSRLLDRLLDAADEPLRVIVRDPSRLDDSIRARVEAIAGSHEDQAVLDQALDGADALFWLVPTSIQATSAEDQYLTFARAAAAAIRRHGVGHVVGVSSAGWDWPRPAGLLSAAHAMDVELEGSGAAYRSLGMPFYMENLVRSLPRTIADGALSLPFSRDLPLPTIATGDIAATAAQLLIDRDWEGTDRIAVFGPDLLNPGEMASIIGEVLDLPIGYQQEDLTELTTAMTRVGASEGVVLGMVEMYRAQQDGIYEEDRPQALITSTSFRTWCETVLAPAYGATGPVP